MSLSLILGGVKSGKSRFAEQLAIKSGLAVTYIATAQAHDDEMQQRIQHHQQSRPKHWQTLETPIHLAAVIKQQCVINQCVLVDCLTLWLTNLLMREDEALLRHEVEHLISCLNELEGQLILVSNETNMGIMPLGKLTRQYCDEIGLLHQAIAAECHNVVLTVAGLPHSLKGQLV